MDIAKSLHLDGNILSLGGEASGNNSGGGSGGSIYVIVVNITGHGLISTEGGPGHGHGCGGAGGRVAIAVKWRRDYNGKFKSYGGLGGISRPKTDHCNAAAGTIFITYSTEEPDSLENMTDNVFYRRTLLLDNDFRNNTLATILTEDNEKSADFEVDELEAVRDAVLQMYGGKSILTALKFKGDMTGLMHILSGQRINAEYVFAKTHFTVAPASYRIEEGAEIWMPSTVILLGRRIDLLGKIVGVQNLTVAQGARVIVYDTAQTAILEDGKEVHLSKKGSIGFTILTIQKGSDVYFLEEGNELRLVIVEFYMRYASRVTFKKARLFSQKGQVESLSMMIVDYMGFDAESGPGRGSTVATSDGSSIGTGGSKGGHGGVIEEYSVGTPYDSLFNVTSEGSGGGNGDGLGGHGGGHVYWEVGNLYIDGFINVRGEAGRSGNSGGGSGGGVMIEAYNFTGYGRIDCSGGNGSTDKIGGGGAGGRISVHIGFYNRYAGELWTKGGIGSGGWPSGAAGTVYIQHNNKGPMYSKIKYRKDTHQNYTVAQHRQLVIDNHHIDKEIYVNHKEPWLYTYVYEGREDNYVFEEVDMRGHSNLMIAYPNDNLGKKVNHVNVTVHRFLGDRTGLLHLRTGQTIFVESVLKEKNETFSPCSFRLDNGSESIFSENVHLLGTRTVIGGLITGVIELILEDEADVVFYSTANTAFLKDDKHIQMTKPGNFSFPKFFVMKGSIGEFNEISRDVKLTIYASEFLVKYQGKLNLNRANLDTSYSHIESQGEMMLDGRGYSAENGAGAGKTIADTGTGGGHGGYGGGAEPQYGGEPHDSIYKADSFGSGGGNGNGKGGNGGGLLFWNNGGLMEMNGVLSLRGSDGEGSGAGGGSGGAVKILTTNITGHGVISVVGGHGVNQGGGGSGGRIAVYCEFRYQYGGRFDNYGGMGGATHRNIHAGGAGTSYKEENLRPPQYAEVKYDKTLNMTYVESDHNYLHSDNNYLSSPAPTMVMDGDRQNFELEEMDLSGTSRLLIFQLPENKRVDVIAHTFIGDKTGQVHIRAGQHLWVEVKRQYLNRTEAPAGFITEPDAELILPVEFHSMGVDSKLKGELTGVKVMFVEYNSALQFYSSANTARFDNEVKIDATPKGNFSFGTLHVKGGGVLSFLHIENTMSIELAELKVKFKGNLYMNHALLISSNAHVEAEGIFHLDGHGLAGGTGSYGGSHGGEGGGPDPSKCHAAYNSVFTPVEKGAGGGNSGHGGTIGGSGGGILVWRNSKKMELNGLLSSKGLKGSGKDAGGGAGGSILIYSFNFTGHGEINIQGADGVAPNGGGGGGGRCAVKCEYRYSYGGLFTTKGGDGGGSHVLDHGGAAGTLYVEENMRPLQYRELKYLEGTNNTYFQVDQRKILVDNVGKLVPVATVIMENKSRIYEVEELEVTGASRVVFEHPADADLVEVIVHLFIGDKTGQIHMRKNQLLWVEYKESVSNRTEAPANFIIEVGAEVVMPTEVHFSGTNTSLNGILTGVHHMYVENGARVIVSSTAQTAQLEGEVRQKTIPGNFFSPSINVRGYGIVGFRKIEADMTITTAFLEIKTLGQILMNHGNIIAGDIDIESGGWLNLCGTGYEAENGAGAGSGNVGGSFGGKAGRANDAAPHGNLFNPDSLGSGGGGARGGGRIHMNVGGLCHIDGRVTVAGESAEKSGGGGSGGSLTIHANNMSGHGVLDASGGNGYDINCGGGSGGRIAIEIEAANYYGGLYSARGGKSGSSGTGGHVGGPGTIYKYESKRGPQYRELKYNPRLNKTMVEAEHRKLSVDNEDLITENYALIKEKTSKQQYYEFEEVQVEGHSYVHIYHPDDSTNVTAVIHELTGNRKGFVRVQDRQHLVVNFVESDYTYLDIPCGFHVDQGGELILPTEVHLRTQKFILEGHVDGAKDLYIHKNSELHLSQTSTMNPSISDLEDNPSTVSVPFFTICNDALVTEELADSHTGINVGVLNIKNGGTMTTDGGRLYGNKLIVEKGAKLSGSGLSDNNGNAPGTSTSNVASGGSHAGSGK